MYEKLISPSWKKSFLKAFERKTGFNIPYEYVKYDVIWAYTDNNKIKGGFAIINNDPLDCRLIQQIPDIKKRHYAHYQYDRITELTCYFIDDPKYSLPIKLGMTLRCLAYPAKEFFYSYELHKKSLGDYYALGKPKIYYRGNVLRLEGMPDDPYDESIESLSKWGIIRIFILSSLAQIKRRIAELW